MAHNDIGAPENFRGKSLFMNCGKFDKGVVLCEHDRELTDGQSPYMLNMVFERNMLRTRFGQERIGGDVVPAGVLHSSFTELFYGRFVYHVGGGIYTFDGRDTVKIGPDVPDCDSFMLVMDSKLYIFFRCVSIFVVDSSFSVTEHIIEEVKVVKDARYDLKDYTELEVPDNMIMYRICIDYKEPALGTTWFELPCECDTDKPIYFKSLLSGNEIETSYTVDGTRITLDREILSPIGISFVPAKGSKYGDYHKIFGCTAVCTYGGNSSGGTRAFFTGNKEYPGYYFYSELLSPLHIKRLSYDILGDGNENIGCFAKQKGDLIAFGERGVYRLTYTFDQDEGADFLVTEISAGIGCDIPGSVKLIDNRLVFANSRMGIYIITASEYTDELSIRRISGNIDGNSGTGFLYEDSDSVKNSVSSDHGRRYMLACPSGNAYVWDYGNSPYIAGDDPLTSERRLCWYLFDGIYENCFFEVNDKLFGIMEKSGKVDTVRLSDDIMTDFGADISCTYGSRSFDVGDGFAKKVASELYINASASDETSLAVFLFADGVPILMENYTFMEREEAGEALRRLFFKVPGNEAYRFTFMLMCVKGKVGLYDAAMRFCAGGIYYK
ncbi:MAG: hypothetical protein E7583_00695 [Ruminococcaceae bacterium]|nr:hypothetical protein [Oscillospiraceae bacterium]